MFVEPGFTALDTAFRASFGYGKPVIVLLAEYDALNKLGYGCGHNIIIALAAVADNIFNIFIQISLFL